jgi:hypothetical protein
MTSPYITDADIAEEIPPWKTTMTNMSSFDFGFEYRKNFKTNAHGFSDAVRQAKQNPTNKTQS